MNRILATTPLLLTLIAGPTVTYAQSTDTVSAVLGSLGLQSSLGNGLADQGAEKLVELLINSGVDPLDIVASMAQFGDQKDLVAAVSQLTSDGVSVGAVVSAALAASPSASAGELISAAIAQVADNDANVAAVVTAALNNGVASTDVASAVIIGNSGLANSTSAIEPAVRTLVAADVGNAANIVEAAVVALAYVANSSDGDLSQAGLESAKASGQLVNVAASVNGIDEIVAGAVYGAEAVSASDRDLSDTDRVLLTENSDSVVEATVGDIIASVKSVSEAVFNSTVNDSVVSEAANGVFTRISIAAGNEDDTTIRNVVAAAAGNNETLRRELVADVGQTQPAAVAAQVASTSAPTSTPVNTTDASDQLVQLEGAPADAGGDIQEGAVVTGQSAPSAPSAPPAVAPPSNNISAPSGGGVGSQAPASNS